MSIVAAGREPRRRTASGSPNSSARSASCAGPTTSSRQLQFSSGDRARRSPEEVVAFVDAHRDHESGGRRWGVEPICEVLEIAPSTYYAAKSRPPSARAERDAVLIPLLVALFIKNYSVYGRRKLTKAARRQGLDVGRDQVARLMRAAHIRGASRSRKRFTHQVGPWPCAIAGPGQPRLHRHAAEREVGCRLHLLLHMVRHRLCRLRHRCVLPAHRRLEGGPVHDHGARARRVEHGRVDAARRIDRRRDLSHRCGIAIHLDCPHRASRGDRRRTFDRNHRRLLRSRPSCTATPRPSPTTADPGAASTTSSWPPAAGSAGSTRSASTESSAISHRPKWRPSTVTDLSPTRHEHQPNQPPSNPGRFSRNRAPGRSTPRPEAGAERLSQ